MTSLKKKLVLSALVIASLATPAFAFQYPNGSLRSGTQQSYQSGAEFNVRKGS
jgi:hypothetical protein